MTFRSAARFAKTSITVSVLAVTPVALMMQPAPFEVDVNSTDTYVAEWTTEHAEQFPACDEHGDGDLAAAVVVIKQDGTARRMSTDAAFAINTDDERANNVWVVGTC